LALLTNQNWQSSYELILNLHVEAAEAEYLYGNFEKSKNLGILTLQKANTILDKVKIYKIQIQSSIAQNRMSEALDIGIQVLKLLGVRLPAKPKKTYILASYLQTKLILAGKRIEDLAYLPRMTDPCKLAAMKILMLVNPAASQAGSLLFPLTILAMVRLSVKYGNSEFSTYGYCIYGAMLCDKFGQIEGGYRFGNNGLLVLHKFNSNFLKCKVYNLFNSMIWHFKEPVNQMIAPALEGIQSGLETGDIQSASYINWLLAINLFLCG